MTVIELIRILDDMPHNSKVYIMVDGRARVLETTPEMVWDDENGKYVVLL